MIKKRSWFFIGGMIFFLWGIINTWFSVASYGIEQGMYMWFCNLALFAIAYGLLKKDASWLIAWLSVALFTQSLWIIDNIWRIFTKKNLFGLIEFMYQPGYPLDEFLVSHYHYFIIPTILLALLFLKQKKYSTTRIVIISGIFILGFSYLLFPREQNLNCIQESCITSFENLKGPIYSLIFSLIIISAGVVVVYFIEKLHKRLKITKKQKIVAIYMFCIVIVISVGLLVIDVLYKKTLPKFVCLDKFENSEVKMSCKFTTEFKDKKMWLVYSIENKLSESMMCTTKITLNREEQYMHKDLFIESNKKYNMAFILPYPEEDVKAKLSALCTL